MTIDPAELLALYTTGRFPMAHSDGLYLHDPDPRAIFPLPTLRTNARALRHFRASGLLLTQDTAFRAVMEACADRDETWITPGMVDAYSALHQAGHALSVEVWTADGALVGGLYGVRIGKAFFGESMFGRVPHALHLAFHHTVERLRAQGFTLFDTQYINPHTERLGAVEIPRAAFRKMLAEALQAT